MLSTIRKIKGQKWYRYVWYAFILLWLGFYLFTFLMRQEVGNMRQDLEQKYGKPIDQILDEKIKEGERSQSFMEAYEESLKK